MAAAMGVAAESKILRRVVAEICSGEHLVECMEQEMRERIERLARNVLDLDLWTNSPICLRYNGMPPDALDASLPFAMHRHEFCIEFMLVLAQALHKGYLSYGRCSGRDSACRSSPSPRSSKVSLTHAVGELIKTDLPRFAGSIPRLVRASRIGSIDDDASTEAQVGAFYQYVQDVFLALAKDRPFITLIDWLRALRKARLVVDEDCTPVQPLPADFAVLSYAEAKCIYASALSADAEDDFHTQHKMGLASFRVALTKVASMICMPSPSTLGNLGMMMDASAQPGAVTADYLAAAHLLRFSWSLAPSLDDSRVSRRYSSIVEKSGIGLSLGERAFFVAWCLRREVLGRGKGVDCAWDGRFAADTAQRLAASKDRAGSVFSNILDAFSSPTSYESSTGALRALQRSLPSPTLIEMCAEELHQRYRIVARARVIRARVPPFNMENIGRTKIMKSLADRLYIFATRLARRYLRCCITTVSFRVSSSCDLL